MGMPRTKPLSMAVQKMCIQQRFPHFKYSNMQNAWIGKLQPSKESAEYEIKIKYKLYEIPQVFVLSPKLRSDSPHVYRDSGALCLYYPDDHSWNNRKLLGDTVILWTAEWLYYYELWLATGQWFGPEAPHDANKKEEDS